MSFSREVKEELAKQVSKSRHCQVAELAALLAYDGELDVDEEGFYLSLDTENLGLMEKYIILMRHLFSLEPSIALGEKDWKRVLETVKMWNMQEEKPHVTRTVDGMLVQQQCCKRAFIRGAFLAAGSISDPNKSYHFEIACKNEPQAVQMQDMINSFGMDAKIVLRKKYYVVYLKEGSQIVDILNVMEAHVALMELENVRILKEMRNSVNRKVNCETANISKTVNAAIKQVEDIEYIRDTAGLESLPENLREMALLRLEYPEAALKELGTYLNPPVGKSGVNHRLRKLSAIAEELREQ